MTLRGAWIWGPAMQDPHLFVSTVAPHLLRLHPSSKESRNNACPSLLNHQAPFIHSYATQVRFPLALSQSSTTTHLFPIIKELTLEKRLLSYERRILL